VKNRINHFSVVRSLNGLIEVYPERVRSAGKSVCNLPVIFKLSVSIKKGRRRVKH
jgi:hypothetical protein